MSLANHSNIKSSSLKLDKSSYPSNSAALQAAHHAAARIAPIWPLDKTVAVNPWWQWRDQPIEQVAAHLTSLANVQLLMPKAYYRDFWQKSLLAQHLQQAAQEQGVNVSTDALVDYLNQDWLNQDELNQDGLNHKDNVDIWKNLTDWLDEQGAQNHKVAAYKMPWRDEVTQQISQSCGMFFSYAERLNESDRSTASFYQFWRQLITQDAGVPILMGEPRLKEFFKNLPNDPETVISCFYAAINTVSAKNSDSFGQNDSDRKSFNEKGFDEKSVDEKSFRSGFEAYCTALLMDINGWAAVFAQRNESQSSSNESIQMSGCASLLAVRLAWEWAIWWLLESDDQSKHASSSYTS